MANDPNDRKDPATGTIFDDAFVRSAPYTEPDASTRLAQLRRIDAEQREKYGLPGSNHPTQQRTPVEIRHQPRWSRNRWAALVTVALVVIAVYAGPLRDSGSKSAKSIKIGGAPLTVDRYAKTVEIVGGQPTPSREEQSVPIGHPAPLAGDTGPYQFMLSQPGSSAPVAYDPCRPIHLVINERTAPPNGTQLLTNALAAVSTATGLQFVIDGSTTEEPSMDRPQFQPERYGDVWAPVLVAWTDPTVITELAGEVAGLAGSSSIELDSRSVYLSGSVNLDGPQLTEAMTSPNGVEEAQSVVLHEFGHLVGLDHVTDQSQLMYPSTSAGVVTFASGDLIGLNKLGQGACFPNL